MTFSSNRPVAAGATSRSPRATTSTTAGTCSAATRRRSVSRHVGDDVKLGLGACRVYADHGAERRLRRHPGMTGVHVVDMPGHQPAGGDRRLDRPRRRQAAGVDARANMEWITATCPRTAHGPAGPMHIITSEMGREELHLRRARAGDQAGADQAQSSAAVKYDTGAGRRTVTAGYTGYWAGRPCNALRAWAMTQGYEPTSRPFDVTKNGIELPTPRTASTTPTGAW